jgi:hypothetical protein
VSDGEGRSVERSCPAIVASRPVSTLEGLVRTGLVSPRPLVSAETSDEAGTCLSGACGDVLWPVNAPAWGCAGRSGAAIRCRCVGEDERAARLTMGLCTADWGCCVGETPDGLLMEADDCSAGDAGAALLAATERAVCGWSFCAEGSLARISFFAVWECCSLEAGEEGFEVTGSAFARFGSVEGVTAATEACV